MADDDREFELTFEVSGLTEAADLALSSDYDVLSGVDHTGGQFVTVAVPGDSPKGAARRAVQRLQELGVTVHRLRENLVTRKDIAERANVTQQAVGAWIRGERRTDKAAFPAAYDPVAGGVYLWGEVNDWLRTSGKEFDDWHYPTREDFVLINADLHDWLCIRSTEAKVPVSVRTGYGISLEKRIDDLAIGGILLGRDVSWLRFGAKLSTPEYLDGLRTSWTVLHSFYEHVDTVKHEVEPEPQSEPDEHGASL
jgi:hypothetical protein